jgi:hypothetical protein
MGVLHMKPAWHLSCLMFAVILCGANAATAKAADGAAYFGEWYLGGLLQPGATSPSYRIGHRIDINNDRSPTLEIICIGNQYRLRFFPNTSGISGANGAIALAIDRHYMLMLEAEIQNVEQLKFLEADLSAADLDRVASAQSTLVLTSPGLRDSFTFKAEHTVKAVRVLRASCQD